MAAWSGVFHGDDRAASPPEAAEGGMCCVPVCSYVMKEMGQIPNSMQVYASNPFQNWQSHHGLYLAW